MLVPEEADLNVKLQRFNEVEKDIQFTLEAEANGSLPFLDVLITRRGETAKFQVFRK